MSVQMSPIVDQRALEDFIEHANLDDARRAEAALQAMAASVRMRVVELETKADPLPKLAPVGGG